MDTQQITLFIVGDGLKTTRKLILSARSLRYAIMGAIVLVIFLIAVLLDYFGLILESQELKQTQIENLQLKKQFQIVESKITALESALERVKTFSSKLKLITNVDDENRGLKLAIGAAPKPNQSVSDAGEPFEGEAPTHAPGSALGSNPPMTTQRPPVQDLARSENDFSEETPLNDSQGELAIEKSNEYNLLAIRIDRAVKATQLREQSVMDLWENLSERQSLLNSTPSIRPARGWLTSTFGYRISPYTGKPAMHNGLDIAAAPGTPVFATADGMVTFAGYDESYGKLVTIDHGYGIMTRFAHNSQIYVQVGQKVNRWDVIAAVGSTGRSTGPHCHYEVRLNNIPIDPINYILDE